MDLHRATGTRVPGPPSAVGPSGQSGFGAFSHAVQFEVECGILRSCPQLGNLVLEFLYATSQAYYLEGESLFGCAAYIT